MVSEQNGLMFIATISPKVLILVLVEDGLGVRAIFSTDFVTLEVLILVLVEDGLGDREQH